MGLSYFDLELGQKLEQSMIKSELNQDKTQIKTELNQNQIWNPHETELDLEQNGTKVLIWTMAT